MVKPFKVNISDQIIKDIYDKVKKYPWHEMPNDGGWEYGTNLDYMKEISKYWVTKFDWRKHEKEINKFDRQALHAKSLGFVHPKTNKEVFFEADRPRDFDALIKNLKKASL